MITTIFKDKRINNLLNFSYFNFENRNYLETNISQLPLIELLYLELRDIIDIELDDIIHEITNTNREDNYEIY